jgi:type I restriction enzyme, S subunit
MKFKYSSSWTTSLLDDVTDRGSGHTPSQSRSEYWNGQIKWVSLADSSKLDNLFISNTDKTISELGIKNSSAVKHPAGTVILSRDAGVGKSAILKEEMAVSQHFIVWKCSSKNIIYNIYLYYWLQMMKHEFERMAVGSTIKTIGLPYFKKLEITYPPLLEQCRIAEVLGVWDESIDLLERLIGRVRSRKQGLMQQLLTGKKRFKEFEGSEWKKVSLEKIVEINPRSHPNNLQFVGEFVEMASVSESGHLKNVARIDLDTSTSGYTAFINGDTLVAKITPCFENGKGAFIEGLKGIGFGSTEFFVLRAKLEIIPIYLYYLTRTYDFGMRGKAMMQGSGGQQRVPSDFIRQFAVKLPSLPEQQKIAAVLSAADEEISTLEKQLAAYKQQKLGLMQQLLTGKIRVGMMSTATSPAQHQDLEDFRDEQD